MARNEHKRHRWNLNIHYHRFLLDAVPKHAKSALDIGCGDGLLTFELARLGLDTTGIDCDLPCIERASTDSQRPQQTSLVHGNFLDHSFNAKTFDCVLSVAALHHVDFTLGIQRMRDLVSPGGMLAVVSFARPARPIDYALAIAGRLLKQYQRARGNYWEHNAPTCWPPELTSIEAETLLHREIPEASFIRLMSNRFAIVWRRDLADTG